MASTLDRGRVAAATAGATRLARLRTGAIPYLFLAPMLLLFLVFRIYPLLYGLYISFTNARLGRSDFIFNGVSNYERLLDDTRFQQSLINTGVYTVESTLPILGLPLLLAVALNQPIAGRTALRAIFYGPSVLPLVAVGLIWMWIYNPNFGFLNEFLKLVGLGQLARGWLSEYGTALPAVMVTSVWYGTGFPMIIYLAGLQGIPQHLYEAAAIDGAGWWSRLTSVTVPLMTPTIFYNLVIGIINSFQVFTYAYVMTKGGPLNSTLFYVLYVYRNGFEFLKMGYASALATMLFAIELAMTIVIFKTSRSWVYYEGGTGESKA
jgi:ABC-type sugar transport system permease subunit